jgi:hypothetical protein
MEISNFEPGDQIIYIPTHANDDPYHPDAELGFVTSKNNKVVFCRYWDGQRLRTTANSEATNPDDLYLWDSRPQREIDNLLKSL